jgi:hypothetical protein
MNGGVGVPPAFRELYVTSCACDPGFGCANSLGTSELRDEGSSDSLEFDYTK